MQTLRLVLLALVLLATSATLPGAQPTVWILDDDAPANFSDLQAAIDGAGEGDIVVVKPGSYPGVPDLAIPFFYPASLSGKSLTLIADIPGTVNLLHGLSVTGLGAAQFAVLRGLDFDPDLGGFLFGGQNQGVLWVEDCRFPSSAKLPNFAPPRISLVDCTAVHINRCEVEGLGAFEGLAPGPGILSKDTNLSIYDSVLRGGSAQAAVAQGGAALGQTNGFTLASGSSFDGGDGWFFPLACAGPGIRVSGSQAVLWTLDDSISAGSPGVGCAPTQALQLLFGATWNALAGNARSFSLNAPVREGQVATMDFAGEPGDLAILILGPPPGFVFDPFLRGVAQFQPAPFTLLALGVLGASGQLSIPTTIGPLAPGAQGFQAPLQALFLTPSLELRLSGGSFLVLLDAAVP